METESGLESLIGHEETVDQAYLEKIRNIALSVDGVNECKDIAIVYVSSGMHITLTIGLDGRSVTSKGKQHSYSDDDKKKQAPQQDNRKGDNNNDDEGNDEISIEMAHQIATEVQNLVKKGTGASRGALFI